MKFHTEKGAGRFLANAIRQMIYVKRYVVRPVACKIGASSTILSAGSMFVEDMIGFTAKLESLHYGYDNIPRNTDCVFKVDITCCDMMYVKDLEQGGIKVFDKDRLNDVLLHTVSKPGTEFCVSIIFRNAQGGQNQLDNEYAIMQEFGGKETSSSYTILTSRHSDVEKITTKVSTETDHDIIEISVSTYGNEPESEVIAEACEVISRLVGSLS